MSSRQTAVGWSVADKLPSKFALIVIVVVVVVVVVSIIFARDGAVVGNEQWMLCQPGGGQQKC